LGAASAGRGWEGGGWHCVAGRPLFWSKMRAPWPLPWQPLLRVLCQRAPSVLPIRGNGGTVGAAGAACLVCWWAPCASGRTNGLAVMLLRRPFPVEAGRAVAPVHSCLATGLGRRVASGSDCGVRRCHRRRGLVWLGAAVGALVYSFEVVRRGTGSLHYVGGRGSWGTLGAPSARKVVTFCFV